MKIGPGMAPDATLIAMVPVGLNAKQAASASAAGGNAVGAVMVKLGTDRADPGDRLRSIHQSMQDGKEARANESRRPSRPAPRDRPPDA